MSTKKVAVKKLKRLFQQKKEIASRIVETMAIAFPVGTRVTYLFGDDLRFAQVIEVHDSYPRLKVRGVTGSDYWLDAWRVLETEK